MSTADASGPNFDAALQALQARTGKPVGMMTGRDVGLFVLEAALRRSMI